MNQVRDNGIAAENVQARRRDERYNMTQVSQTESSQSLGRYSSLAVAAGIGSMLGSGIIVGLSATITVWQEGLQLSNAQVGQLSGIMTFAIAFGSLMGGRIADKIGRVFFFNWINLLYAVGAVVCIFA
ncbi:MFS transporter [Alloscardovia omnicolens]|nr:MFS transporter [Alloscardovia omnicolens]MDK6664108.1 MFS transporter [Alloscardovia omnicolens]MDK7748489.1 MFS transporter [Alloscardovia omnicolens]